MTHIPYRAAPRWAALAVLCLVALGACQSEPESMALDGADIAMRSEAGAESDLAALIEPTSSPRPQAPLLADREIIRTASVRLRADDHREATAQARALVARAGGFVGSESSQRYTDRVETTLTLRVPAARFDTLLASVSGLEGEVESRTVSVSDVTRQVADVSARLETKRAAEAQYRELLARSGSIEEILQVQERLQQVREDIESTEAQLRALRDQIGLSTITLTLFEASAAGITAGPGFFARAGRSIVEGWEAVLEVTLGLLTLWPFLLLLGGVAWLVRRHLVARRMRKATA